MANQIQSFQMRSILIFLVSLGGMFTSSSAFSSDAELVKRGQEVFQMKGCLGCHTFGGGSTSGPDLKGLFERRDLNWVKAWLANPDAMIARKDPIVMEMMKQFPIQMPNLGLTP